MNHVIMADETEEVEVHSKWLDWTWTLGELFQQPKNEIMNKAIEKIRTKISGKFDANTLLWSKRLPSNTGCSPHQES
jgi:hypothetical protein